MNLPQLSTPDLPVPAGATADEWDSFCSTTGQLCRPLEWSRHDTDIVGVSVDGTQYSDGRVVRMISLYDVEDKGLNANSARELAAKLIEAADAMEALQ